MWENTNNANNNAQRLSEAALIAANSNVLGTEINGAVHEMIKISQKLVNIAEQETQKLVQNDVLGFAILQDEKDKISKRYVQASREFRKRADEFRGVDQNLLGRLNALQEALAEKTRANNVIVTRMREKARINTQQTLVTAQELAQSKLVQFRSDLEKMARNSQESSSEVTRTSETQTQE